MSRRTPAASATCSDTNGTAHSPTVTPCAHNDTHTLLSPTCRPLRHTYHTYHTYHTHHTHAHTQHPPQSTHSKQAPAFTQISTLCVPSTLRAPRTHHAAVPSYCGGDQNRPLTAHPPLQPPHPAFCCGGLQSKAIQTFCFEFGEGRLLFPFFFFFPSFSHFSFFPYSLAFSSSSIFFSPFFFPFFFC